ncbi:hypothetical protein ACTXT7_001672 [Hymenolepis weldensis]
MVILNADTYKTRPLWRDYTTCLIRAIDSRLCVFYSVCGETNKTILNTEFTQGRTEKSASTKQLNS